LEIDPEAALRSATARFEARLRCVEGALEGQGRGFADAGREELLAHWREAKQKLQEVS